MNVEIQSAVGKTENHLVPVEVLGTRHLVHSLTKAPLEQLAQAANKEGFDLKIASGFRSFEKQLEIWNAKARGERALLDPGGQPLDAGELSPEQLMWSILHWSALPGTSRHHWGTDFDVVDAASMPEGYQIQLTTEESNTLFKSFHVWLDVALSEFEFFRPYADFRGGVQPERWHISYAPVATAFQNFLQVELVRQIIEGIDIELKSTIVANLPTILSKYVHNVSRPPWGNA